MRRPKLDNLKIRVNGGIFDNVDAACEEHGWSRALLVRALASGCTDIDAVEIGFADAELESMRIDLRGDRRHWTETIALE